jgi:hypothetical protein
MTGRRRINLHITCRREVPLKYYNQMQMFTGLLADELEIIHEIRHGTLAVFLYLHGR